MLKSSVFSITSFPAKPSAIMSHCKLKPHTIFMLAMIMVSNFYRSGEGNLFECIGGHVSELECTGLQDTLNSWGSLITLAHFY